MKLRRLVIAAVVGAAAYFALFGGDYGLFDLMRLRRERVHEAERLRAVSEEVARLRARADSLESDPAVLERLARERYGMIRSGERLYRFADEPADSAGASDSAAAKAPSSAAKKRGGSP